MPDNILFADALKRHSENLDKLNANLLMIYSQIQLYEAQKTPGDLRPYSFNLQVPRGANINPDSYQVLPKNERRNKVGIYNQGPGDILWSNSHFDPTSILQQISDPNAPDAILPSPLQMVEIGILTTGNAITIESVSAVWGYNIFSATNGNALLTILETNYDSPMMKRVSPYGHDGLAMAAYGPGGTKTLA